VAGVVVWMRQYTLATPEDKQAVHAKRYCAEAADNSHGEV